MANPKGSRTQDLIPIKNIKDGVVELNDGSLRRIILVGGMNFDLKSEDEQRVIIGSFQNLVNSLDFSLQINIHSRKLNIEGYLEGLKERKKVTTNSFLKTQIDEYYKFIESFVNENAIMSKSFFITVPYSTGENINPAEIISSRSNVLFKRKGAH